MPRAENEELNANELITEWTENAPPVVREWRKLTVDIFPVDTARAGCCATVGRFGNMSRK